VDYEEFFQTKTDKNTNEKVPNENWNKRPKFMLKKVCIGQGFRLCFSTDLGGLPYTEEEGEVIALETEAKILDNLSDLQKQSLDMLTENREALKLNDATFTKLQAGCTESEVKAKDTINWINSKIESNGTV
jgi:hypothetical protein